MKPRPLAAPFTLLLLVALAAPADALPFDSSTVEIVEFIDYQCPFSARAQSTLAELQQKYGAALRVSVRHLPLGFHANARRAAEAAEAARLQGKLEAFHERLFANQQALSEADLVAHAAAVGLDVERFKRDLAGPEVKQKVDRDLAIAAAIGASGTPTFYINGLVLTGTQPREEFERLIDPEVALAREAHRSGDAWLSDRLSANNIALWGYLRGGQVPTAPTPVAPKQERAPEDDTIWRVTVGPDDAQYGPADALVTVVEFLDYQCPFCRKLEATMDALIERYPGKIRRVVKHHPLPFHAQAEPAAKLAICAQAQGRFWEVHDALYAPDAALDDAALRNRASALGLDLRKLDKCLAAPATRARIAADTALAESVKATGTPTSFINGKRIVGSKPIEDFVALIDEELTDAESRVNQGVLPRELYARIVRGGKVETALEPEVHSFVDAPSTPILGNPKAKVRITVFADFQCPFCSRSFGLYQQLVDAYPGRVAVAWRHFPLSFHAHAVPAALAAQCLHEQKLFWPAATALMAGQAALPDVLANLPQTVGADVDTFAACMNSGRAEAVIDADVALALANDVKGTPTYFIQGRRYTRPTTLEDFKAVIDKLLAGKEP